MILGAKGQVLKEVKLHTLRSSIPVTVMAATTWQVSHEFRGVLIEYYMDMIEHHVFYPN